MKVLQTSANCDVQSSGDKTSHLISDRFSQPLPHKTAFPPDLAAVIKAWDHLPEAIRAGIVATVNAASK